MPGGLQAAAKATGAMDGARLMALTRDFKALAPKRIAHDPSFGVALLGEGVGSSLAGDVDTGKAILCDTIKATVGLKS